MVEAEFRRAISQNPKYPTAHQWLAIVLAYEQKYDQSVAEMMKAHELDPLSAVITYQVGWMYYFARRYPEAEQRLVRIEPAMDSIRSDPRFTELVRNVARAAR